MPQWLKLKHLSILQTIDRHGSLTMSELVELGEGCRSTTHYRLMKLVEHGLLAYRDQIDGRGRRVRYSLTAEGKDMLNAIYRADPPRNP